MSLIRSSATLYEISMFAAEEASRFGQSMVDVDHLFLALVLSEKPAGEALRSLGVTLEAARHAVGNAHAARLTTLGIDAELPQGRITAHEADGGFDWAERARGVVGPVTKDPSELTSALLRRLLNEPSGLIDEVLGQLGVSTRAILERLDQPGTREASSNTPAARGTISSSRSFFVPASVEQVWALLVTPSRMREWGPMYQTVECAGGDSDVFPGDAWLGLHAATGSGGKPVRPEMRRERIELLIREERFRIAWRTTYPDAPTLNARRVEIGLVPDAGGTRLEIGVAWEPSCRRKSRPLLRVLMSPLHRYGMWVQTTHIGASIGRVFR